MAKAVLSLVATPIGNLADLTFRALKTLEEADFILCEDTRVSRKLLTHYGIKTPTLSYHQHSGDLKVEQILSWLKAGKHLALISDAGTPGISDPGANLVKMVREKLGASVEIVSLPGPCALTAALSLAGPGFDRFFFGAFLPHKKGRQTRLKEILNSSYPTVLYESKHRVLKLLAELDKLSASAPPEVALARELSKKHESFYSGSPIKLLKTLKSEVGALKGEFVVLLKPAGVKKRKFSRQKSKI